MPHVTRVYTIWLDKKDHQTKMPFKKLNYNLTPLDIYNRPPISRKVWDGAGINLVTPGSAVRNVSACKHVTDCAMWPVEFIYKG